jgi:modulator of drug activity B
MKKALIINAHQEYPLAKGELNRSVAERVGTFLSNKGYEIKTTTMKDDWNVDNEVEKYVWANVVILQSPVNWMRIPWSFKKYMDEVYTAGMFGKLCQNDGRSAEAPKENYGAGGVLTNSRHMLSLTFNARKRPSIIKMSIFFKGNQ